jgi:acetylglutamate kinase
MMDVEILIEALPYIRRHKGKTFVVKLGGALVQNRAALRSLAQDLSLLANVGIRLCVVHGGGPQATELASKLGLEQKFVEGRRVTDEDTLEIAKMVFAGKISLEILAALRAEGLQAVGLSGVSADIIHAKKRAPTAYTNDAGEKELVDMGHVGDVVDVDTRLLRVAMDSGYVPILNSLGADGDGNVLNINADTVAAELAVDLGADKFMLLTNVDGILRDPSDPASLVSSITAAEIESDVASGAIAKGMIPKTSNCVAALRRGVARAHVLNGTTPHSLLLELFTKQGAGTLITLAEERERYLSE